MIKLVVTDIDGTLVDDQKRLSPDFWDVVAQLTQKGIIFSVASGRQYHTLLEQFSPIKDSTLFVAENGTNVVYKNRELFINTLDKESADKLIKIGRTIKDVYPILCGKTSAYVENADDRFLAEAGKYYQRLEIVNDLTQIDDAVLKVTMFDFADAEKNSLPYFKDYTETHKVAPAGKRWLDITNLTANKGSALERVQRDFNITHDETLVFGDYLNDLEMMGVAKYSYAMKNAHPDILKAARFITEFDNNNHGVVSTIRKLCL